MELMVLGSQRQGLSEEQTLDILGKMPKSVKRRALYDWEFQGRPDQQLPAGDWNTWLYSGGRGTGKTRAGANATKAATKYTDRIALVGATAADVRDVMIEGESGLLAQFPKSERAEYIKSQRCVRFHNGARAFAYSAEQPNRLRGPQHGFAWCDEPAAWRAPEKVMAMLKMGLRLGRKPRAILTTTPKKIAIIKGLFADSLDAIKKVFLTRSKTTDNFLSLTKEWFEEVYLAFGGTRLGRQELDGELLEEVDALFHEKWILHDEPATIFRGAFKKIVVSIDPSASKAAGADECGIVVAALGHDTRGYVLADLSGKMSPDAWGRAAIQAFKDFQADEIIGEVNHGGDTIASILKLIDPSVPFRPMTAWKDKEMRAEPVAALYERKRITHLGQFAKLEEQMTSWNPQDKAMSPDRLDAMVWAFKHLICDLLPEPSYSPRGPRIVRR